LTNTTSPCTSTGRRRRSTILVPSNIARDPMPERGYWLSTGRPSSDGAAGSPPARFPLRRPIVQNGMVWRTERSGDRP
jgi:hypothetical protein